MPPIDWNENAPADDSIVSAYPANERAARDAVKDIFDIDHHSADDADQGKHDQIRLTDLGGDATAGAGEVAVWNDGGTLKSRTGTGDAKTLGFPSGTKLLFPQASAPTGWTQDTDANDRVIRVVDNTGTGGATGGSWTISGVTVNGHTLTTAEIPAHAHATPSGLNFLTAGAAGGVAVGGGGGTTPTTANTGGGGSHNHGLTANGAWRPAYLDVIKATLD